MIKFGRTRPLKLNLALSKMKKQHLLYLNKRIKTKASHICLGFLMVNIFGSKIPFGVIKNLDIKMMEGPLSNTPSNRTKTTFCLACHQLTVKVYDYRKYKHINTRVG